MKDLNIFDDFRSVMARVVLLSDTHSFEPHHAVPDGDILIHEEDGGIFANASNCTDDSRPVNEPLVVDL